MAHLFHRCPPKGVRGGLRRPEGVGEEIRTFPDFFPTRGGHGVDGVRGGWYINQGAQSLDYLVGRMFYFFLFAL